jgi:hypothetical protein
LIASFGRAVNNEVEEAGSGKPLGRERNIQLPLIRAFSPEGRRES